MNRIRKISIECRIATIWVLSLLDYLYTQRWVNLYGAEIESNALMRELFSYWWLAMLVKMGIASLACAVMSVFRKSKASAAGSWLVLAVYSMLTVYHVVLRLYVAFLI